MHSRIDITQLIFPNGVRFIFSKKKKRVKRPNQKWRFTIAPWPFLPNLILNRMSGENHGSLFFYSRTRLTLIWMRKLLHYYYYCILYLNSFNARPAEVDDLLGDRFRCHTCCSLFSVIIFLVLFQYLLARGSQRGAHLLHPAAGGAGVIG
jgi:hypothetical protein